jgi:hypothetical protein
VCAITQHAIYHLACVTSSSARLWQSDPPSCMANHIDPEEFDVILVSSGLPEALIAR